MVKRFVFIDALTFNFNVEIIILMTYFNYRRGIMEKFKIMSTTEKKKLEELLKTADDILKTKAPIIFNNKKAAKVVGSAIGGALGASLVSVSGFIASSATLSYLGGGAAALLVPPQITLITVISGAGIGLIANSKKEKKEKKEKKKEYQQQANYVKDITVKMEKIYNKYENLKKEYERTSRQKDDIIRDQAEKIREYELIFEALRKQRDNLETNLVLF